MQELVLRVPEEKSYMILPEIEEEEEEGQKLSLTSLLLGDSSATVTVLYKVHVNTKNSDKCFGPGFSLSKSKAKNYSKIMLS